VAFFLARHTRTVDGLGYLVLQRHRLYAEEGLAGMEVAVGIAEDALTVEYDGEALSRYEVECDPATGVNAVGRLRRVKNHTLFETKIVPPQLRLFDLDEVLGEEGWVTFLKLDEYAPPQPRRSNELQQELFTYVYRTPVHSHQPLKGTHSTGSEHSERQEFAQTDGL
jgi:hypothetical protein